MEGQTTIFDMLYEPYKITKPIRLIELFAGYGSQALALKYLGVDFQHWKICEWAVKSVQAYKDIHCEYDETDPAILQSQTKEEMVNYLFEKGISSNYNEPMTKQQINRLSEEQLRNILNNIYQTHNLVNIQQVKGKDLEIFDTDKYNYILTYSFPCQDLSLAGKGKGMSDTSTRSGMLWEVERILSECKELGTLPQVLLMENVPQVHSKDNIEDFNKWQLRLEEFGYKNYAQDLIATDYGIPQTRNRTFMVSILGDYSYTFPKPIPLKLKLKDMLEDEVNEKYFLSDKMKEYIFSENDKYKVNKSSLKLNRDIACSKTTREGNTRADASDYIVETCLLKNKGTELTRLTNNANTLMARDYKGFGNQEMNAVIENKPKKIGSLYEKSQAGSIYSQEAMCPTLTTESSANWNVLLGENTNLADNNLRIRKLTPRECFRLMGVKDEDYEKCAKNQSDSSLYHLSGDSIVVNILMAIFEQMLKK